MLDGGKALQIGTDLADDFQGGAGIDARNPREVDSAGFEQGGPGIKTWGVLGGRAALAGAQAFLR